MARIGAFRVLAEQEITPAAQPVPPSERGVALPQLQRTAKGTLKLAKKVQPVQPPGITRIDPSVRQPHPKRPGLPPGVTPAMLAAPTGQMPPQPRYIAQMGIPIAPLVGAAATGLQTTGVIGPTTAKFVTGAAVSYEAYKQLREGKPMVMGVGGLVPVGGPGVPEPPTWMVAKQWSIAVNSNTYGTFRVYFFRLIDGRMMCYNPAKDEWKMWRPKKPLAVIVRGKTTLSQAVKVQRYLDRMWRTVARKTKALKLA